MTTLASIGAIELVGVAALITTFFMKPRQAAQKTEALEMASKFVSVLDHIGDGLKKFFTSPVAAGIEQTGISIAEIEFPALNPLLQGLSLSLAKAQTLAKAANPTGDTTAQVTALVVGDAQQVFDEYEQATGATIESPTQQKIVADFLQLLSGIPAGQAAPSAPAIAVVKPAPVLVAEQAPAPAPALAPAPVAVIAVEAPAAVPVAAAPSPGAPA